MREFGLARTAVAVACALLTCAALAGCAGWGTAARSVLDRLVMPEQVVWARVPEPDAYAESYADATGAGTNYVYDVRAATAEGDLTEVRIVSFGGRASGEGWLKIRANGGSGSRYESVERGEVPEGALAALGAG